MKEYSLRTFKLPMRIPSRVQRSQFTKMVSVKGVIFPTGYTRRDFSEVLDRILKLNERESRRLEDTWLAIAGFLAIASPGIIKGIPLNEDGRAIKGTCDRLFHWVLKSWCNQGGDWVLTHLKSLCDWALYYAVESDYSQPEIVPGSLGCSRDGWATFSFLKGGLLWGIRPTRGPYSEISREQTNFLLYEFYSLKGALPLPSKARENAALKKHRETLSSGGTTPSYLIESAKRWGRAYREKFPPKESSMKITINSSSILESSRSHGGRSEWLRNLIKETKEKFSPMVHIPGKLPYMIYSWDGTPLAFCEVSRLSLESLYVDVRTYIERIDEKTFESSTEQDESGAWQKIIIGVLLDMAASKGLVPTLSGGTCIWPCEGSTSYTGLYTVPPEIPEDFTPEIYETKASVVNEQGDKARIITILSGVLSTLLHLPRTYSYSSLEQNPQIGTIGGEGTLNSFMKKVNGHLKSHPNFDLSDKEILSLDLTRATDTFHQDLCSAISQGYFFHDSSPKILKILLPLITSSFSVEYPKDSGIQRLDESNRGIPMGNPSSWFILNCFTEFFWDLSGFLAAYAKFLKGTPEEQIERLFKKDGNLRDKFSKGLRAFPRILGDPLSSRCGDDQISICGHFRALIFENLLRLGGGIISPGVHFRSKTFGIYTKQFCHLNRDKRELSFVDILRVRALSTPDSRLPGKKEVPPSWSRGKAAFGELEWWLGDELRDKIYRSSSTFLSWRYFDFLKGARSLGIELYLPQPFGGLNYPYYRRDKIKLDGKTKRMLSILLRNDLSLSSLLKNWRLGSLWSTDLSSKMGEVVAETLEGFLSDLDTSSYERFTFEDLPKPTYPRWWEIDAYNKRIASISNFKPLKEVIDEVSGRLMDVASFNYPGASLKGVPSLRKVASRFQKIRNEILASDSYNYQSLKIQDFRELGKRMDWKMKALLVDTSGFSFLIPSLLSVVNSS